MVCSNCVFDLARRLVRHYKIDWIDALVRAKKGLERYELNGGNPASCAGTPNPCGTYSGNRGDCVACGCTWYDAFQMCAGTASSCDSHSNELGCIHCGCTWEVAPRGWTKLQYVTEPPTSGAFNKLKFAGEVVPGAWHKILYEGE